MTLNIIEQCVGEVMNAEPVGLEDHELVEPEHIEASKKETIQIANNLKNRETHYKLRESLSF